MTANEQVVGDSLTGLSGCGPTCKKADDLVDNMKVTLRMRGWALYAHGLVSTVNCGNPAGKLIQSATASIQWF